MKLWLFLKEIGISKFLKIMRLSFVIIILLMLEVSANSYSQKRVVIKLKQVKLKAVFNEIERQTGFSIMYSNAELDESVVVDVNVNKSDAIEVIENLLDNSKLRCKVIDDYILISPFVQKKKYTIEGQIVDKNGIPLPGVTIKEFNSSNGTSSDVKGKFKLVSKNPDGFIVVSFIGMETQKIAYKSGKYCKIILLEKKEKLGEVVVTGYANINKESFTGNAISISKDDLLKVSKTNVVEALQTFDPSFRILENNQLGSDPNALPEMYIRGRSGIGIKSLDDNGSVGSLNKSRLQSNPNLPTFIMDGFEVSVEKIYDMDPTRVKSITILKDAAASALYGSRAANGVIVITTVAPKSGKLSISYNVTGSVDFPDLTDYNLMNAKQLLETEKIAGYYQSDEFYKQYQLTNEYNKKLSNIAKGYNTYWLSKPLESVINSKHSLYVEGGKENIRFGVNLLYNNKKGVMIGSYRDRIGAGFNLDYRIKSFQIKNRISYFVMNSKESPYGSFNNYTSALPYDSYKNEHGAYLEKLENWHGGHENRINPLYESGLQNFSKQKYEEIIDNLSINWSINDYLRLKGQFSITKRISNNKTFIDPLSTKNSKRITKDNLSSGELRTSDSNSLKWNSNLLLMYNRYIKKHNINFTLGINANSNKSNGIYAHYRGFPSGTLNSPNYAQEIYRKPTIDERTTRLVGFLSSLNYTFNDIYLVDLSVRLDGSSEFGSKNKFAPFWAGGLGINFHNYDFLKNNEIISNLKLRASYGSTGKINFPSYVAKTSYDVLSDEWYRTGYGTTLKALGNKDLSWETTNTIDFGLKLGLFNNRIFIEPSVYNKKTIDLITQVSVPSSSGFSSYYDNLGEVENKGFEINSRFEVIKQDDLYLSLYARVGKNENKILKISRSLKSYNDKVNNYYKTTNKYSKEAGKAFTKYEEGSSLTAIYGMKSLGIDPSTGKEVYLKKDGTITYKWDATEQIVIGDTEPDLQGSFGFSANYKNFSLFTSFLFECGGQRYNYTLIDKVENAKIYEENVDKRVFDSRWKKEGDISMYKSISNKESYTKPTSRFMQDYNVLSLSSITLGYNVDRELLKKYKLGMLRFELGANNLFRFSTVKQERGTSYPFARSVNFSLKLSF